MEPSQDDISLQEPLIPFTWPLRNDPGWEIFDAGEEVEGQQQQPTTSSSSIGEIDEGQSDGTAQLFTAGSSSLALVKAANDDEQVNRRQETREETITRLCKIARQPVC